MWIPTPSIIIYNNIYIKNYIYIIMYNIIILYSENSANSVDKGGLAHARQI